MPGLSQGTFELLTDSKELSAGQRLRQVPLPGGLLVHAGTSKCNLCVLRVHCGPSSCQSRVQLFSALET